VTHYEALGVPPDASPEEIKKAYKRMARKHHPDRGGDGKAMVAVNKAYDCLSDPEKRSYYDAHGQQSEKPKDSFESRAMQTLYQILMQIAAQAPVEDDFVECCRQNLVNNI